MGWCELFGWITGSCMYPCQTVIYSASGLSAWGLLTKSGRSLTGSKCYLSKFCSVLVEYSHSLAANRDYDATLRKLFEYQLSKCLKKVMWKYTNLFISCNLRIICFKSHTLVSNGQKVAEAAYQTYCGQGDHWQGAISALAQFATIYPVFC